VRNRSFFQDIRLGAGVFVNFNCAIPDIVEVIVGDRTQIGPGFRAVTA